MKKRDPVTKAAAVHNRLILYSLCHTLPYTLTDNIQRHRENSLVQWNYWHKGKVKLKDQNQLFLLQYSHSTWRGHSLENMNVDGNAQEEEEKITTAEMATESTNVGIAVKTKHFSVQYVLDAFLIAMVNYVLQLSDHFSSSILRKVSFF